MYKMLVLDMDGTLLNERQEISKENVEAIKDLIDRGIKVVLASGRAYQGMSRYLEILGMNLEGFYSITCSGSLTVENKSDSILHEVPIEHEDLLALLDLCETFDLDMSAYTKDNILVHQDNLYSRYDAIANDMELKEINFHEMDKAIEVFKVSLINENPVMKEEMIRYFPTIQLSSVAMRDKTAYNPEILMETWRFPKHILENYTIVQPLPFSLEILHKSCNKAVGVQQVAQVYGIKREEIVCVGDSGNDLHMIEYAGLGVAMGNAIDQIKAVADIVTLTNEENGVAEVIKEFFKES
ncbi:Cof-type HAD-IIB family hydrolase [Petrocella sp. FN5]|uniref:Cof-type HAD-IIB family hydrolase n=1 Tax=Petrocella sp. FN5 TaxID=3032002 RepID=UPI0023D9DFE4|nr:Cof-type HAD-IIB family hydrolase [Petrocella sp. FN5]MDF1618531.1 Cof-type HAD-IIB family hydrolase [Petrocella sp. FN5]